MKQNTCSFLLICNSSLFLPVAAVTQGQNLSGLKQHNFVIFSSGGQKSRVDLLGLKLRFGRIVFFSRSFKEIHFLAHSVIAEFNSKKLYN